MVVTRYRPLVARGRAFIDRCQDAVTGVAETMVCSTFWTTVTYHDMLIQNGLDMLIRSIIEATHASSILQTRSRTLWTVWLKSSRREGQQTSFHREDVDSGRSEAVGCPYGSYKYYSIP